jgi:hypothetical protein
MSPSHEKSIKCLLVVKHHAVAGDCGMLNLMSAYPSFEQGFCLGVVAQHYNVQWFNCTVRGYGH